MMLLLFLLFSPIMGVLLILISIGNKYPLIGIKSIALSTSILSLFLSLIVFILFDFSTNQFQFVHESNDTNYFDFFYGIDGLSIYFMLLTTIIIPISILSNWISISKDVETYLILILLLETLLLVVFLVLDILLFYIFFESILPPLFILIGIFGSDNRVKASFYLFLYTLMGSLFLLLSIVGMSSIMSTTDYDTIFKRNFIYFTQIFLFYGIFIAFAVKTPTIFLNTWLLKAHVESPLGGSIILAAIVLKLSLYGILRLILPVLPKAYMEYTFIVYLIGVITIVYASLSTLRTIDVKELIAYSSVSHAAVYLLGVFSNSIQGIEGGINLGLAHGLVSPGLFICAGGILYDRSHTRLIAFYRGMAQIMPLFAILFFILCLANCGVPLTFNFIGEFMSLYGIFETSSLYGVFASLSIIFSAGYTIYMYQRISFGGSYSSIFTVNIPDLNKREFIILITLVVPTVGLGIYPGLILDAIHYSVSTLIYSFDFNIINCDAPIAWGLYFQDSANGQTEALTFFWLSYGIFLLHILQIVYLQLVKGKAIYGYIWAVPQLFSDYFRILTDRCSPGLEWALHNPPKPHAFTGLPLQSTGPGSGSGSQVPPSCPDVRHLPWDMAVPVVRTWVKAVLAEQNVTRDTVMPYAYNQMVKNATLQALVAQGFIVNQNYVLPLVTTPYFGVLITLKHILSPYFGVLSTLKHILSPFLSVFWCILPVLLLCFIDLFNTDFTINVYILDFYVTLTNYHLNFALIIWGSFNLMRKSIMLINHNRDAYNKGDYKSLIIACISLLVVLCLLLLNLYL